MTVREVTHNGIKQVLLRLNGQPAEVRLEMNPDLHAGEVRIRQTRSSLAPALDVSAEGEMLTLEGTDSGAAATHSGSTTPVIPREANWQTYSGPLPATPLGNPGTRTEIVITVSREGCRYAFV